MSSLPTRCGVWNVTTQLEVSGTDNSSPTWLLPSGSAAAAGAGWVYCDYTSSGVTLSANQNYKAATFHAGATAGVTAGPFTTVASIATTAGLELKLVGLAQYPALPGGSANGFGAFAI